MNKNKIPPTFRPNNCIYLYKRNYYLHLPEKAVIKYYVKDNDRYIAICKRKSYLYLLLLICSIVISTVILLQCKQIELNLFLPDVFYYDEEVIYVNHVNTSNIGYTIDYYIDGNNINSLYLNNNDTIKYISVKDVGLSDNKEIKIVISINMFNKYEFISILKEINKDE